MKCSLKWMLPNCSTVYNNEEVGLFLWLAKMMESSLLSRVLMGVCVAFLKCSLSPKSHVAGAF